MTWKYKLLHGDSLEILRTCPDNYFDAMVTDPPAGIEFMGKEWDTFKNGQRNRAWDTGKETRDGGYFSKLRPSFYKQTREDRDNFIAFMTEIMTEAFRTLKPGAHAFIWALPKTSHWTACALEDAGFEIRDCVQHWFGQGFPKSLSVSKAIDKMAGATREVTGSRKLTGKARVLKGNNFNSGYEDQELTETYEETIPATEEAKQWEGWGSALKPACEFWWLVRKPLSEKSVAANVLKWGTGALNIDACRVHRDKDDVPGWHKSGSFGRTDGYLGTDTFKIRDMPPEEVQERCGSKGRWPSHLLLSHSPGCLQVGTRKVKGCPETVVQGGKDGGGFDVGSSDGTRHTEFQGYGDKDGLEEVAVYECEDGCPVAELDEQSGNRKSGKMAAGTPRSNREGWAGPMPEVTGSETYGDQGGASRYFQTFQNNEGEEEVWECEEGCPVAELDTQSGVTRSVGGVGPASRSESSGGSYSWGRGDKWDGMGGYKDSGGASRYFTCFKYQAKPAVREKNAGLEEIPAVSAPNPNYGKGGFSRPTDEPEREIAKRANNHPTVKSIELCKWLTRLITPLGGKILDPFAGSGSIGCAAVTEKFLFVGIDQDEGYCEIARARLKHWSESSD